MITEDHITRLVEQAISGTDHFLVGVEVRPGGVVVVEVDNDRAITLGELAEINRKLRNELGPEADELELQVSSPGMGRPFKVPRQYVKHTGRMVSVQLHDGRTVEGRLEAFDPEVLQVRRQVPSKVKGRPPKWEEDAVMIPVHEVQSTKASITFN
ncbi:MAG: hypothetical protein R2810_13690 [Flavobacteriales bacterium]|nr:hypothetical protein [Flavobacteriales bacterium]MCB0783225.1 hypothetical protein [Flavobacteriales bacterium]MCB0788080.1 hypothetical protein [Flavobacteriales bacterium]MCB0807657.1 hypothetical protein [Flavobacteriales bacterium]MCB0811864.1 hypothetical protein [Flavobacteriales bacterium]